MPERQNVILGAGLSGMAAAYTFQQADADEWQVFERNERVGGLARSIVKDGYAFDYGPHVLFTIIDRMEVLIRELLEGNFHAQDREAYIYHHQYDAYTEFPYQAHLAGLPANVIQDCLVGLVKAVEQRAKDGFTPTNYEDWMRGLFGDGIADHFLMDYGRKLWTVEPADLDWKWIGNGRVPTPEYERIIAGALTVKLDKIGTHSKFWYPKVGAIESLPAALGRRLHNVRLNKTVEQIELPDKLLVCSDGEIVPFRRLILTTPLCYLDQLIPHMPVEVRNAVAGLVYIGTCVVNLGIKRPKVSTKHWVYFYEDLFPFSRLSFPAEFSPSCVPARCSSISTENSFSKWKPFSRDKSIEDTISSLQAAGILFPDDEVEVINVEEILPSYVMFDHNHERYVEVIRSWLKANDIWTAGRFGEWRYFNMDHSMQSGVNAAEEILKNEGRAGALTQIV